MPTEAPNIECCPKDGEPLTFTFDMPGCEWLCMICGTYYPWTDSVGKPRETPGLKARYEELKAKYNAGERPAGAIT